MHAHALHKPIQRATLPAILPAVLCTHTMEERSMSGSRLVDKRKSDKITRRYFDEQTKREAIEQLLNGSKTRAELCKELEIQPSQLLAWMGHYTERKRDYAGIEAGAGSAGGIGGALAGALNAGLLDKLPQTARDEIAKAVGLAVLKAAAATDKS